jgi:hypothetical protein
MTPLAAAIIIAGGIAATSAGFAGDTPAANPAPQDQAQGMMGGQQGQSMMGNSGNMMGMMNMMTQMSRMVEDCNHMMESASAAAPAKPPAQTPPG